MRAQATLFVILGIVLLSVFSFAWYARNLIITEKMQTQADLVLSDFIQSNSVTYYVESCLEQVSNELLLQIGRQGGVIDFTDKNAWEDYFILNNSGELTNISYALVPNTDCSIVSVDSPAYPYPLAHIDELSNIYSSSVCGRIPTLDGFFGQSSLPALCHFYGANAHAETAGYGTLACKQLAYTVSEQNMQNYLQEAITDKMKECVDFSIYENVQGHALTLDEQNIETTVIYTQDAIVVEANYPFLINIGGRSVVSKEAFSYKSPLRIKKLYEFIMSLVEQESTDENFYVMDDYHTVRSYDPNFKLTLLENQGGAHADCPDGTEELDSALFDDVIVVEDTLAKVNNRTLSFQFAIKDRIPVLDYIHETTNLEYDYIVQENETIYFFPKGFDPDDKEVTFNYFGWKETEDARFDFTCTEDNPAHNCVEILDVAPHNWTTSSSYLSDQQNADYKTDRSDTGAHNVTIIIVDESGLEDFQVVKVLVFDLPVAVANGSNGFDSINNNYASVEDPYWLNGSASTASVINDGTIESYNWTLYENTSTDFEKTYSFTTANDVVLAPYDVSEVSFKDVVAYILNTSLDSFPVDYRLQLNISTSDDYGLSSVPSNFDIKLYECLPARGESSPYPYNSTDVYHYNHACCAGTTSNEGNPVGTTWGTLLDSSTTCYELEELGILSDFTDDYTGGINPPSTPVDELSDLKENINNTNDPYNRTITRACDGTRGNICQGNMTYTYTRIASCDDFLQAGQVERCAGSNNDYTGCEDYTYPDSFEKTFGLDKKTSGHADGICNPTTVCAQPGGLYLNSMIHSTACQGGCGSNGCSLAVKCACDVDNCNAECDANNPFEYDSATETCYYYCDYKNVGASTTCEYQQEMFCPESVICNSADVNNYDLCEDIVRVRSTNQYYYYLGKDCDNSGCHVQLTTFLEADYCYNFNANPTSPPQGDFCPSSPVTIGDTCYYGNTHCFPTGGCVGLSHVSLSAYEDEMCDDDQTAICGPLGPSCS